MRLGLLPSPLLASSLPLTMVTHSPPCATVIQVVQFIDFSSTHSKCSIYNINSTHITSSTVVQKAQVLPPVHKVQVVQLVPTVHVVHVAQYN